MSEYRVDDDTVLFHVVDGDERTIATFKPTHLWAANHMADTLNTETASLQAELATQAAALESQSAMIAELQQFRDNLQATLRRQQLENERYEAAITDAIGRIAFSPFEALQILKRALTETSEEIEESESAK